MVEKGLEDSSLLDLEYYYHITHETPNQAPPSYSDFEQADMGALRALGTGLFHCREHGQQNSKGKPENAEAWAGSERRSPRE